MTSKQQHQPSAASILEALFRSSAPGMSTFRVLYNLEVGHVNTPPYYQLFSDQIVNTDICVAAPSFFALRC